MDARITYGKFGRPHGTRGEVRLWPFNAHTTGLKVGTRLYVAAADGPREVVLRSSRVTDKCLLVTLEGYRFRDQLEALVNAECQVSRNDLPPPDAEEFYHSDLVGLSVFAAGDEVPIGRITTFLDLPSPYDVMAVEGPRIDGRLLVMWRKEVVLGIDLDRGIDVAPLETWAPEDFELKPA